MLGYESTGLDFGTSIVWGQARWGIAHTYVPQPINTAYSCDGPNSNSPPQNASQIPLFIGGYTPVDSDQHCPGLMSKTAASALCTSTGGYLCATQSALNQLNGKQLGCSLDGYPMWSAADSDTGTKVSFLSTRKKKKKKNGGYTN